MLIDLDDKITITLLFEDKESKVSWDASDTSLEDAKFMFLCSCEALVDGEFEILDNFNNKVDVNSLSEFPKSAVYFLKRKSTSKISNLLIDGRRKLFVEIEPLEHIEAKAAIKYMCIGSNLLKHTNKGFPHIRLFQLSSDLRRILWYTKKKKIEDSQVYISSIRDLTIGQVSENFLKYPLKMLENYSFTIYFKKKDGTNKTLDLTCKNEKEFDLWVIGIKALHSHYSGKIISKNDLLNHSKSYNEQVKSGNIGHCSKYLLYKNTDDEEEENKNKKSIETFLTNRNLDLLGLARIIVKLCNKIEKFRSGIEEFSNKDVTSSNKNKLDAEGYEEIFNEEAIVDDLETQKNQMSNLFKKCENELTKIIYDFFLFLSTNQNNTAVTVPPESRKEFGDLTLQIKHNYDNFLPSQNIIQEIDKETELDKIDNEFFIKEMDIKTWKVEIDLENVGDIINRFYYLNNEGFIDKLKNLFKNII